MFVSKIGAHQECSQGSFFMHPAEMPQSKECKIVVVICKVAQHEHAIKNSGRNCNIDTGKHSMAKATGSCERTTKVLGKHAGETFGCETKAPLLLEKETAFAEPTLAKDKPTKVKELKWNKQHEVHTKKTSASTTKQNCLLQFVGTAMSQ